MDITDVILHQHGEQRRMFAELDEVPASDVETLAAVWNRLEIFLETHAEAEERYFYPQLLRIGTGAADSEGVDDEVKDAIKDHNEIRDAILKTRAHQPGSEEWQQAVLECRIANDDHMAEEERQDLTDFRRHASLDLRHEIGVKFVRYEALKAATGVPQSTRIPKSTSSIRRPASELATGRSPSGSGCRLGGRAITRPYCGARIGDQL